MAKVINFKVYSFFSLVITVGMVMNAIQKYETFYNIVVYLTSQKINLLIFFNFLMVVLINIVNTLVWIFFDQIRTIESKVSLKNGFHIQFSTLWISHKRNYSTLYF